MEEVQCALLGFGGADCCAGADATGVLSASLRATLHPTELALISEALPLGGIYARLRSFAEGVVVGGHEGYLAVAVGLSIREILDLYEADVTACRSIVALECLTQTYPALFQDLMRMAQQAHEPEVLIIHINRFVRTLEFPATHRVIVGEKTSCAVLYCVAHLIANGTILVGREKDFFVTDPKGLATGILSLNDAPDENEAHTEDDGILFTLHKRRIPCEMPLELAQCVVAAGTERHCLQQQLNDANGRNILKDGQRIEDVSRAIFLSIYNMSLWKGGRLVLEELAVRVEAARALWSKALWAIVGEDRTLGKAITSLRDVYLGHRGDLWGTFVERSFPALAGFAMRGHHLSQSGKSEGAVARAVRDAFQFGLRAAQLDPEEMLLDFELGMSAPPPVSAGMSVDEAAETILQRIQLIWVTAELPPSTTLVITPAMMDQYHELLLFQLTTRYALHALHSARGSILAVSQRVRGSGVAAADSISSNVRTLMSKVSAVHQFILFVLTTVDHYFQLDVIEARHAAFRRDLSQSTTSTANAKQRHKTFLIDVADAVFFFEESSTLRAALRSAAKASFMLFVLALRAEHFFFASISLASAIRIPADVLNSVVQLERIQEDLTISLASELSSTSRASERALWTRLDLSRYFTNAWHSRNQRSAHGQRSHPPQGGLTKGLPISLSSLVNGGGGAARVSTSLLSTAIPPRVSSTTGVGGDPPKRDDF